VDDEGSGLQSGTGAVFAVGGACGCGCLFVCVCAGSLYPPMLPHQRAPLTHTRTHTHTQEMQLESNKIHWQDCEEQVKLLFGFTTEMFAARKPGREDTTDEDAPPKRAAPSKDSDFPDMA